MNEQQFKKVYPLFNLICIASIGLLIIPLSMVMHYTINEGNTLFSVEINPYQYGDMFMYFIFGTMILNFFVMIASTIFLVRAKKKFKKINLVPEINDHDEGMSFVTYESMKRSYTWLSVLLPLFTGIILIVPDNFVTKPVVLGILLFLSIMMYLTYYIKNRKLLKG
ncbi:hypothetical protein [Macrococcoides canis]|uniref:DUF2178 domain-containing protein n=1 Tax=Macrococcoides canis TaxID=1855823 RepID=A0A4V3BG02_9STAP|nr:hypothetical protein [Macrococcus canis]MEE1107576.1 hypothetical protein [Macrococcus canis]TDM16828.1 hypothetical protein ETI04_06410 [Macrococcus canis]TDM20381.1 hypothetical protein ETI05_08200 [Macrococcus canis]TDM22828.1 hypothetical protein ETI02_06730 [Macrococcus canis]TDM33564.1 hypothetical protein ETI13_06265 [Macrococcus canis]